METTTDHSNVGLEFVLHKVEYPASSPNEDEFVRVEVVEVRTDVPGDWDEEDHRGWKAEGDDGCTYYCNWNSYPSTSMTPNKIWRSETGRAWYNVTLVRELDFRPGFVDRYADLLNWCPRHLRLSYIRPHSAWDPCFECEHDKPSKVKKSWVGWR